MEKRKNNLIVLLSVLSILIFILVFYLNSKLILEKREIIATLEVGNRSGFDTNATALTFGIVRPGSSASRNIEIANDYSFPVKFEFSAKGNIKDFLVYDKTVYLNEGEKKKVSISTIDPWVAEFGNYSGKVIVLIKRDF
ncbi:MAG: hypothetical protein PVJ67_04580 [Candidatus Pacearchaeota archaeon]|jgi:hypothetical protein